MKKIIVISLLSIFLLTGCIGKFPKIGQPVTQILEGEINIINSEPAVILISQGWRSIQVFIYGADDVLIELNCTIPANGKYVYYLLSKAMDKVMIYNCNGYFYRIIILY